MTYPIQRLRAIPEPRPKPRPKPRASTLLPAVVRAAIVSAAAVSSLVLASPVPVRAGGPFAGATEFTQIANNFELVAILGKEAEGVALEARQLLTQAELLRTQFMAYQNMIRNTLNLPETIWGDVTGSLLNLRGVMAEAQSLASDGAALDRLLRGRMILDPFYQASPLGQEEFEARYDDWNRLSRNALSATLNATRLTLDDVDTEAALLDRIADQGRTAKGQVEAIQIGNELSASIARQLAQLRTIIAAQNEQTSLFQARWMAMQDAEEARKRQTVDRAEEIERRRGAGQELIGSFTRGVRP